MSLPTIGVYIPTAGRDSLRRTLHSISQQRLIPGDEVLVIGDGPVPSAEALCKEFGEPFRYLEGPHTSDWGHSQANMALHNGHMSADLLVAQDDDDIFLPRAFEAIRAVGTKNPGRLLLFQSFSNVYGNSGVICAGITPYNGYWDGHSLVVQNASNCLGWWGKEYSGDQSFIFSTFSKCGLNRTHVHPEILTMIQPHRRWRLWYWEVRTSEQVEALRQIRNECREWMTHDQSEITPEQQKEWWRRIDPNNTFAFLFTEGYNKDFLGFCLLRREDGRLFTTYGLRKEVRGRRLGYELVEQATLACQEDAYADQLEGNIAVWKAHKAAGWIERYRKNGLIHMYRPWPQPGDGNNDAEAPARARWLPFLKTSLQEGAQ